MNMICKNCGHTFEGNYCNNCGQKAETHSIDISFVAHDLQHGLFHFEGGIIYSAKELFTRPGDAIREYIEGKRIRHYKPISMLIVLATFYGFFYHYLDIDIFKNKSDNFFHYSEINEWIAHHFSIITLMVLPILSFSSFILFRNQGYNFTEHLILNSFYSSQKMFLRLATLPIFIFIHDTEIILAIMRWLLVADLFLMFWTYGQFFKALPKFKVFLLALLATFINIILIVIILTVLFLTLKSA